MIIVPNLMEILPNDIIFLQALIFTYDYEFLTSLVMNDDK
jgi:hypothetical protein